MRCRVVPRMAGTRQIRTSLTAVLRSSPRSAVHSLDQVSASQFARFAARAGLPGGASVRQVVNAVQAIPYGRPGSRTAEGVIGEWKGTCSTKHALLAQPIRERGPDLPPGLVHRVYRVSRRSVIERHGADATSAVPDGGAHQMGRTDPVVRLRCAVEVFSLVAAFRYQYRGIGRGMHVPWSAWLG
jgi:hypothetical protein